VDILALLGGTSLISFDFKGLVRVLTPPRGMMVTK
jgi:hypothetical protein